MSDYLDKIQTQKKDGTPLATVPFRDSAAREDITTIQNELTTDTTTIEGNPLNFSLLSAQTAKSTILSVEPIQDLHGYDKPWVGGAGKNQANIPDDTYASLKTTNGVVEVTSASAVNTVIGTVTVKANTEYICSGGVNAGLRYIVNIDGEWYGAGLSTIPSSFTPSTDQTSNITVIQGSNAPIGTKMYPQIEVGTTATSWQPYENLCPISGRTEIGILGGRENLVTEIVAKKVWRGLDGVEITAQKYFRSNKFAVIGGKKYTSNIGLLYNLNNQSGALFWNANGDYLGSTTIVYLTTSVQTFVAPNNAAYCAIDIGEFDSTDTPIYGHAMVEQGEDTTYKHTDLTISLGQTVYGGTLDLESGELVVTHERIAITNDISISKNSNDWNPYHPSYYFLLEPKGRVDYDNVTCISNIMVGVTRRQIQVTDLINACSVAGGSTEIDFTSNLDTTADVKQFLINNNAEFVYKLATPITIELTPHTINLLKGVNNISTDGDKITLTYRDGSVATLGDLTSAVDNLDSKIDESKILTDTVTGDKYILVVTNGVLSVEQISN